MIGESRTLSTERLRMGLPDIYLHRIATVVPETSYTQEFGLQFLLRFMGDTENKRAFLSKVYQGSAIYKRHSVVTDYHQDPRDYRFYPPNAAMTPEPGTKARNDLFVREANRLALKAVRDLLGLLPGLEPTRITHLITVSCTGFSAPGFDWYLARELPLDPGVRRLHLGFMGCYAAFPALRLARDICLAHPGAKVLVVNVELCSVHFQQKFDPEVVVANALFADGVSAAYVSADAQDAVGPRLVLREFVSRILPDSEREMAWSVGDRGFDMRLSAYVPRLIEDNILPVLQELLQEAGLRREDIALWAIHPGGKAILEKVEKTLGLTRSDLRFSYDVLWNYGNMSSATIMFVLHAMLSRGGLGHIFGAGFGPGLTLETGHLEKVPA